MVIPRWSRAGMSYLRYFDAEMGDALTESLQEFAGNPNIHFVIVTGGTPGYFNRHFSIPALIEFVEAVRASGREWPDNAAHYGGFFDKAMALCETTPKPVIAAISGTALAGAFEFTLACDIRIGGWRLSDRSARDRTGPAARRQWHTETAPHDRTGGGPHPHPYGAAAQSARCRKEGSCSRNRSGKAIDRAMEIAKRFCSHTPESLGYIKRLVRIAIDTPLAEGLALERNLFMRLCVSDQALARMRSYEAKKITDPSRSLEA
jgi:enoyl-CoA hydratase/carnithine racemase